MIIADLFNTRDEAEMEYLKIAQDLEMYGVSYFEIKVQSVQKTGFKLSFKFFFEIRNS